MCPGGRSDQVMKRFILWVVGQIMNYAKRDPDISLAEYQMLERKAEEIRQQVNKPKKARK